MKESIKKNWNEILNNFAILNYKYCHNFKYTECVYYWNETTTASFLSSATIELGGYSIAEYSATKGGNGNSYRGRRDLYIGYKDIDAVCECKQVWIDFNKDDYDLKIESALSEATVDTINSFNDKTNASQAFAIVFIPILNAKSNIIELALMKTETIYVHKFLNPEIKTNSGNVYTGLITVIKEVIK